MNVAANITNTIPSTSTPVIGPILNGCTNRKVIVRIRSIIIAVAFSYNCTSIYIISYVPMQLISNRINAICEIAAVDFLK